MDNSVPIDPAEVTVLVREERNQCPRILQFFHDVGLDFWYPCLRLTLFTTVRVSLAFPDGRTLASPSILHRCNDGRNQCPRIRRGGDESTIVASFFLALLPPTSSVTQKETLSLTQEQTLLKCSSLLKYVYFLFQESCLEPLNSNIISYLAIFSTKTKLFIFVWNGVISTKIQVHILQEYHQ